MLVRPRRQVNAKGVVGLSCIQGPYGLILGRVVKAGRLKGLAQKPLCAAACNCLILSTRQARNWSAQKQVFLGQAMKGSLDATLAEP